MHVIYSTDILFFPQQIDQRDTSICQICMNKHTGESHSATDALKALGQYPGSTSSTMMQKRAYETAPEASFKKVNKQNLKHKLCCILFFMKWVKGWKMCWFNETRQHMGSKEWLPLSAYLRWFALPSGLDGPEKPIIQLSMWAQGRSWGFIQTEVINPKWKSHDIEPGVPAMKRPRRHHLETEGQLFRVPAPPGRFHTQNGMCMKKPSLSHCHHSSYFIKEAETRADT